MMITVSKDLLALLSRYIENVHVTVNTRTVTGI